MAAWPSFSAISARIGSPESIEASTSARVAVRPRANHSASFGFPMLNSVPPPPSGNVFHDWYPVTQTRATPGLRVMEMPAGVAAPSGMWRSRRIMFGVTRNGHALAE